MKHWKNVCAVTINFRKKKRVVSRRFKIADWKKSQITLSIEIEVSRVFYGFRLLDEEDKWVDDCTSEDYDSLKKSYPITNAVYGILVGNIRQSI